MPAAPTRAVEKHRIRPFFRCDGVGVVGQLESDDDLEFVGQRARRAMRKAADARSMSTRTL